MEDSNAGRGSAALISKPVGMPLQYWPWRYDGGAVHILFYDEKCIEKSIASTSKFVFMYLYIFEVTLFFVVSLVILSIFFLVSTFLFD